MDINDIMNEDENRAGAFSGSSFEEEEEFSAPAKRKKSGKKGLMAGIGVLIIAAVLAAGYFLILKKKPSGNFLTGPGGPVIVSHGPNNLSGRLINTPPTGTANKTQTAPGQPAAIPETPVSATANANAEITKTKPSVASIASQKSNKQPKKDLNDLFTVKYNNNSNRLPMPGGFVPGAVPPISNFKMPDIKNIGNKLKGLSSSKEVIPTISGYSAGLVAASCGGAVTYLRAGDGICGWTLLRADNSHAVFSQAGQIKKINY